MGFLAEGDRCSNHASKLIYSVFRVLVEVYPFRVIRNDLVTRRGKRGKSQSVAERSRDPIPLSPCRAELISSRGHSAPLRGSRRRETHGQKNGGRHHRGLGADSPSKPTPLS